jgi:hypothetical protein
MACSNTLVTIGQQGYRLERAGHRILRYPIPTKLARRASKVNMTNIAYEDSLMVKSGIALKSAAIALLLLMLVTPASGASLNKSIKVEDGGQSRGESTVNGSITVGRDAFIDGSLETVNGTIRIDENTRLQEAKTVNGSVRIASGVQASEVGSVNGSIRLGENVTVGGEVSVVNGKIDIGNGSHISDDVSNVNGEIRIVGSEIGGDLTTVNGDVLLTDNSVLKGDLRVEKPNHWGKRSGERRKPKVVIGPGSEVLGEIVLEREVELYISDSATVRDISGVMSMNDAVRFSGAHP